MWNVTKCLVEKGLTKLGDMTSVTGFVNSPGGV